MVYGGGGKKREEAGRLEAKFSESLPQCGNYRVQVFRHNIDPEDV
jgi:hypothetical protein